MRKVLSILLGIIALALTFFLGLRLGSRPQFFFQTDRLSAIMGLIHQHYVDELDMDSITEQVIPTVLTQLDPHSSYLSPELNKEESEALDGSFEGIGIQFNRLKDTVIVSRVIEGGGSDRAGLKPGDRILKADSVSLLGKELTNERVMSSLKGKGGTVVALHILRAGKPMTIKVVRGPVPVSSIDASYMVDKYLYVRINRWGAITHEEFLNEYVKHKDKVAGVVLDLRDNAGGYLETAVALSKEFLPKGSLIVYTEGRNFPREDYKTKSDGALKDMPLVVLVNEFSASASEIFAAAMQDHDRATIIGRRTFGKGLVQRPFSLNDGSVIRLTVARYYAPSGRGIQKKYKLGQDGAEAYAMDLEERYEHGELYNSDSVLVADTTKYYTRGGRIVHGGGGVTPDVFIPRDSTGINAYYIRLLRSGSLPKYAFDYADKHRALFTSFRSADEVHRHLLGLGRGLLYDFARYAEREGGVAMRSTLLEQSGDLLLDQLHALIADNASMDAGIYYRFINLRSKELDEGIKRLKSNTWRPKPGDGQSTAKAPSAH